MKPEELVMAWKPAYPYATATELFEALAMPFEYEDVEWRPGSSNAAKDSCLPLCYLDARAVMNRLNSVCLPANWQNTYTPDGSGHLICNLGIRVPSGEWVWKADGAGKSDIEGPKGMMSDAFKRAAVRWGIGLYLYDIKAPWVEMENKRISKKAETKLKDFYEDFCDRFGWGAGRAGFNAYKLLDRLIDLSVPDQAMAQEFMEKNKGMLPQLPVEMRKRIVGKLERVGATATEAIE